MRQNYYVYRFLNHRGEVIYIGRTNNIKSRIYSQHYKSGKPNGHLPKECYEDVGAIEYTTLSNKVDSVIYELYLIDKYKPKYNTVSKYEGSSKLVLEDVQWLPIKHPRCTNKKKTLPQDVLLYREIKESILQGNKMIPKTPIGVKHGMSTRKINALLETSPLLKQLVREFDLTFRYANGTSTGCVIVGKKEGGENIMCVQCGATTVKRSNRQKYCSECSEESQRENARNRTRKYRERKRA